MPTIPDVIVFFDETTKAVGVSGWYPDPAILVCNSFVREMTERTDDVIAAQASHLRCNHRAPETDHETQLCPIALQRFNALRQWVGKSQVSCA